MKIDYSKLPTSDLEAIQAELASRKALESKYDSTLSKIEAACKSDGWANFEAWLEVYDSKMKSPKKEKKTGGKRTKMTPELKNSIITDLKAGLPGSAIKAKYGCSIPTIQGIKKEAGLVKSPTTEEKK